MKITGFHTTTATLKIVVCVRKFVTPVFVITMIIIGMLPVMAVGDGTPGTILITHGAGIITGEWIMAGVTIMVMAIIRGVMVIRDIQITF